MFNSSWGGQIAWLLPAALALFVALLWLSRRAPRSDRTRAAALLWGATLLVTIAVFSFGKGIIHEYYAVALAPSIGALVGMGTPALWARRAHVGWRLTLAAVLAGTAVWSFVLLDRSASWHPWLRVAVLVGGLAAAAALLMADKLARRAALALAGVGLVASLAAPAAYSLQTASTAHSGSLPSAGPSVAARGGFGGGFTPGGAGTSAVGLPRRARRPEALTQPSVSRRAEASAVRPLRPRAQHGRPGAASAAGVLRAAGARPAACSTPARPVPRW